MLQRGKADLGVQNAVFAQLIKQVKRHQPQLLGGLHQTDAFQGAKQVIGQSGSIRRGDKPPQVFLLVNAAFEQMDNLPAQGAVQVEMQFDLGKVLKRKSHEREGVCALPYRDMPR